MGEIPKTKLSDHWINAIMRSSKVRWPKHSVNLLRANLDLLADESEYEKIKDKKGHEGK